MARSHLMSAVGLLLALGIVRYHVVAALRGRLLFFQLIS